MEVAAVGEATVYNNFVYNKLLAPQSVPAILFSEAEACCLGTQSCETVLGRNYTETL